MSPDTERLTVAITGPTGDIGRALVRTLERSRAIGEIRGMARRPIDPKYGFKRLEYRQGNVLDEGDVERFVAGADVVVHLAFIILGSHEETRSINLEGSRNVFQAAIACGAKRLVYASSVAAYGFHTDNPQPLTEDVPPRGTSEFYYSAQKAELEGLLAGLTEGVDLDTYVFRPCIVAGPDALLMVDNIPYVRISEQLPGAVRRVFDVVPMLKPVVPDPGVPYQLVHHDDVATAIRAAIQGRGEPGVYNLAGDGELTVSDLASEMGYYAVPVPELAVEATAAITARLPFMPPEAAWIQAFRVPAIMDTTKARKQLGWRPKHSGHDALRAMVAAARAERRT
ncbi:MAG: NAD-dependent epimerase/dehydratase family protein [Solirubrobacteraceae bacterium]